MSAAQTPYPPVYRFATLLAEKQFLQAERLDHTHPIFAAYAAELTRAFRARFGLKKKLPTYKIGEERRLDTARVAELLEAEGDAIFQRFRKRADAHMGARFERLKAIEEELTLLAKDVELAPAKTLRLLESVWDGDYHTQGFSASRYAEGRAEMQADVARHYGIPVEVRRVEEPSPIDKRAKLGRWEVHVGLETDLELEVLRRKPGPTLREWIRLCWKRQVNPRVFNPFLPVGLEERLGLDYYGNERPGGPSHGGT